MELLGDVGNLASRFGLFGEVIVSVQDRCMVIALCTKAQKSFWTDLMVLLGDEAQVEPCFGMFGDSANLDAR
jgi:hypothetical protein